MKIQGIIPPIITPMNPDESVNYEELKRQVNRQISAGVHGIFCFGTNGECYILRDDEKEKVLRTVVETAAGRVPVYAGTGCVGTADTLAMSKMAQDAGADVLSIITPYFASASQSELIAHYTAVAQAVSLPIVLYNIPARTGVSLAPATVEALSHVDNIVGVKDSSGNFDNMLQYMERTAGTDFSVLSGNDSLILWNLLAGGAGGIAGCANVYPRTMVGIYKAFQAGDTREARRRQDSIRSFRNCFRFGNPNTIVKKAVELLGYPVGACRKPFDQISAEGMDALRAVLDENRQKGLE